MGLTPPTCHLKLNAYKLKTSLAHRDRLGVEFFDFVGGGRVGCGGGGDFHLDESFGKGFGVYDEGVACTFGLGFVLELACLRVGVDGEEGTAGGDSGNEGAGSAFVPFKVAAAVVVIGLRHGIGYSSDFHDFTREDVLISRKIFITASVAPCGTGRPSHVANRVGDGGGIDGVAPESRGIRGVG